MFLTLEVQKSTGYFAIHVFYMFRKYTYLRSVQLINMNEIQIPDSFKKRWELNLAMCQYNFGKYHNQLIDEVVHLNFIDP